MNKTKGKIPPTHVPTIGDRRKEEIKEEIIEIFGPAMSQINKFLGDIDVRLSLLEESSKNVNVYLHLDDVKKIVEKVNKPSEKKKEKKEDGKQ